MRGGLLKGVAQRRDSGATGPRRIEPAKKRRKHKVRLLDNAVSGMSTYETPIRWTH